MTLITATVLALIPVLALIHYNGDWFEKRSAIKSLCNSLRVSISVWLLMACMYGAFTVGRLLWNIL